MRILLFLRLYAIILRDGIIYSVTQKSQKGGDCMPHIIIKGMDIAHTKQISKAMIDDLEGIIGSPRDYFTLEVIESRFIVDGDIIKKDPFIQINWFDRGQDVQDQTAACITKHIKQLGYAHIEIFFIILERKNYYENGVHL